MEQVKGPKTPKFAQLIEWIFNPLQMMEKSAKAYGDKFKLFLVGDNPSVFVHHPQAIKEIFTASPDKFDSGRGNQIIASLLGEQSLVLLDGSQHQRQRKLLTPPFHGDRMKSYGDLICKITEEVISDWKIGEPFAVRTSIQEISLRVILQAVFGLNEGERYDEIKQLIASVLDVSGSPLRAMLVFVPLLQKDLGAWSPWGHFLRQQKRLDDLLYAEIEERRDNPDASREDILSLMMAARDEQGQPMTNKEIRDELMTLLVAGHETTASSLTWAFYWIHHLPEVKEKLLAELDKVDTSDDLSLIAKLPYLNGVCAETLRIYPIALIAFPRINKAPIKIMDCEYPAETWLTPCIYLTHHREDLYPEPKQFKPERFIEKQYSPYEYLPFGGGNRRCIGMAFALFEMKLVLTTVLQKLDLAIVNNQEVKPTRRGGTLAPSDGKWLVATAKRNMKVKVEV
ncbi:cytochrome P450 [Rivularia sp. PCC 7116]|uniref:cytochrome P450 n=1 Tax=Rivularia sp. PCC 7116 TaxID=373994 RepID=UPI00029F29F9|nr:cytochrome P450 [Rivularia sp. PCC 7116]AFY54671.1 cytochrome P450 [Rivularia sp. PCC 7116]